MMRLTFNKFNKTKEGFNKYKMTSDYFYNATTTNDTTSHFNITNTMGNLKTPRKTYKTKYSKNNFSPELTQTSFLPNIHQQKKKEEKTPEKVRQEIEKIYQEEFVSQVNTSFIVLILLNQKNNLKNGEI